MPRFSIVVPAYNAEATLAETLDAVIAQSYPGWECVVVDDGSVDGTLAMAMQYADRDERIRVVHQENKGSGGAYNTGVSHATGDYIVMCSADDILLPDCLSEMAAFIEAEPGYDIYSSNGYFWRPGESRETVYDPQERSTAMSYSLSDLIRCCFYSVGAAYRRDLFALVGGYRTNVFGEDYDFWMRSMALGARHRYLPRELSLHRVSATQKSANLERAYRSDISLVTSLTQEYDLSDEELAAVDECIAQREYLIGELHRPARVRRSLRAVAVAVARRILGERRLRQWRQTITSIKRTALGRGR